MASTAKPARRPGGVRSHEVVSVVPSLVLDEDVHVLRFGPGHAMSPFNRAVRICAGIISWQDGPALENAIRSVFDVVDEIVVVDGLIDGIEADGIAPLTDREELQDLVFRYGIRFEQGRWPSQSAQRQVTLEHARLAQCDWLLAIDADEELRNRDALRPWLQVWRWNAFPLPFYFTDEHAAHPAAFKALHVPDWKRYVAQGSILENQAGEVVQVNGQNLWHHARESGLPYLVHRPELRPEARRSIRLSEHEVQLEPYPENVKAWLEPVYVPALISPDSELVCSMEEAARLGIPVWYCPACGRRFAGPGSCSTQHEQTGLERLEVAGG